jgi:hypothetical protein
MSSCETSVALQRTTRPRIPEERAANWVGHYARAQGYGPAKVSAEQGAAKPAFMKASG